MAKFDLKFKDCYVETDTIQVEVCNGIIGIHGNHGENYFEIDLDKSTAIKFAKTLRTEINKITESEVNNG